MTMAHESEHLIQQYASHYGHVGDGLRLLIKSDPEFAGALGDYVAASSEAGSLEPKIRELLLLAHDVSITNLDRDGAQRRVVKALDAGATEAEIRHVIELVTMLSLHGLTRGLPMVPALATGLGPVASSRGGYWDAFEEAFPAFHQRLEEANPAAFASYQRMGAALWRKGGLEPVWAELVFVVADLSNTHLFTDGAAFHIRNALHYGATDQQVLDAVFLTVPSIIRSIDVGFLALQDGLAQHRQEKAHTT